MNRTKILCMCLATMCLAFACDSAQAQTLEEALTQVYQTNPTLAAERAKLRGTDEQVSQALSNYRPSIDAVGSTGQIYQNTPNNPLVVPPTESLSTHSLGVQVTQPIFRGFRTVAGIGAAEKQVAAERANLLNVEEQVFLDTATAYIDVVRDQEVSDLNLEYQNVLKKQLHETDDRFSAHDVTRTDLDQATARLRRAEAGRMQAEGNLAGHRATYQRLTGEIPGKLEMPKVAMPPVKNMDEAVELARKGNFAIAAAGYSEDEAHEEVKLSRGSLLPEVSLVGGAQRQWGISTLIPGRQDTAQILAQVTIPLYRSGSDYSKTRAAVETVTERHMELEDTRRQAEQMVIAAWQNMLTSRAVMDADKAEAEAAKRALHGVRVELPAGTRDTLDVLNAEQEQMDARISLVQAQHDEALSILQIRAAIGALTAEAMKLPVQVYDPNIHYEATRDKLIGFDTPSGENEMHEPAAKASETQQSEAAQSTAKVEPIAYKVPAAYDAPKEEVKTEPAAAEPVAAKETTPAYTGRNNNTSELDSELEKLKAAQKEADSD
jgi:outer membrane protein